jgi:hypothetical protein
LDLLSASLRLRAPECTIKQMGLPALVIQKQLAAAIERKTFVRRIQSYDLAVGALKS